MRLKNILKKMTAAGLVTAMSMTLPMSQFSLKEVHAASAQRKYVKEFRLFIKEGGSEKDAKNWCDSLDENKDDDKNNDWYVIPGNVNEGASGKLKSEVAVFLCYQQTNDPDEAVTDIAVMNEQGNYSEGAYEMLLDEQRDTFRDMINDMADMIEEYRVNYNNEVPTAIQAHDYLNNYIEDDSGKLLGDLLLDISDDDLVEVFLQANGQVVLTIQEQLAFAGDTKKTTWLDRLEKLGGYDALYKQYYKAYNKNATKAKKALDVKYKEKATIILDTWDDIKVHIDSIKNYANDNGIGDLTEVAYAETVDEWLADVDEGSLDVDTYMYLQEQGMLGALTTYEYEDGTLLDFFMKDKEEFSDDNIRELYPLCASITDGQIACLNESITLYQMLLNAYAQTVMNDEDTGKAAEFDKELSDEDKKAVEEAKNENAEALNDLNTAIEPISVYEGVDRGVFEGGVAVTSLAETYSSGAESSWANSFVESGAFSKTAIGLAIGTTACAAGAVAFAIAASRYAASVQLEAFKRGHQMLTGDVYYLDAYIGLSENTCAVASKYSVNQMINAEKAVNLEGAAYFQELDDIAKARQEITQIGMRSGQIGSVNKILTGLKIGLAVACVILAIADIVMTSITLYKYYNVNHIPIPKYMVDLSYDDNKETSYITYKSVKDQSGACGDLNGDGGKQWLALYATHDADAGEPILAPDGNDEILVQKGKNDTPNGYNPLHFFGTPNTAQNLTFADGEKGWSYNDNAGGTYVFFKRDAYGTSAPVTGTSMSTGRAALIGGFMLVCGMAIGVIGGMNLAKKKDNGEKKAKE